MVERRRSKRLPLNIPVRVYGRTPSNRPFRDITVTKAISVYGGLIPLAPSVKRGQKILLVNSFTEEERECRVVYVGANVDGKKKVAVEFANGRGDFWHVYAPLVRLTRSPQVTKAAS
jgi:hypothetical protein